MEGQVEAEAAGLVGVTEEQLVEGTSVEEEQLEAAGVTEESLVVGEEAVETAALGVVEEEGIVVEGGIAADLGVTEHVGVVEAEDGGGGMTLEEQLAVVTGESV